MADYAAVVLHRAAASRLLLLTLILMWRTLFRPYDTSASLDPPCLFSPSSSSATAVRWPSAAAAFENSVVWDSVYFVRIARCGYEYEQTYAFLPLLPISLSILSRTVFAPLIPLIGQRAVLALSGYVFNNVAFVLAAVCFYRLSAIILKDKEAALRASILFCCNPASIFYSSIYSESLYSLLSIGGLYYLVSGANNRAMLCFALSGAVRSNGILNAGYFCFLTMHKSYDAIFVKKRMLVLIAAALRCLCIFVPFLTFQAYGYYNLCHGRVLDEMRPWCKDRMPLLYNYIQSHYWGVGFLRYFQLKQLPNFLLASPILSLALSCIVYYVKSRPKFVFSLGFQASFADSESTGTHVSLGMDPKINRANFSKKFLSQGDVSLRQRKQTLTEKDFIGLPIENRSLAEPGYLSDSVLPYVLHLGIMAATSFFIMHVQVATRFLSASPPIYWFASYLFASPVNSKSWGYFIWVYCAAYIFLGSLLFSNFYPFT